MPASDGTGGLHKKSAHSKREMDRVPGFVDLLFALNMPAKSFVAMSTKTPVAALENPILLAACKSLKEAGAQLITIASKDTELPAGHGHLHRRG